MTHIPSFLVGSIVSGGSFLLIHRELSHRERLSSRWIVSELVNEEGNKLWNQAKSKISQYQTPEPPDVSKFMSSAIHNWNDGVNQIKNLLSRK